MTWVYDRKASRSDVMRFLKGSFYPASKSDLVRHALELQAPERVVEALTELPDREYSSAFDVNNTLAAQI